MTCDYLGRQCIILFLNATHSGRILEQHIQGFEAILITSADACNVIHEDHTFEIVQDGSGRPSWCVGRVRHLDRGLEQLHRAASQDVQDPVCSVASTAYTVVWVDLGRCEASASVLGETDHVLQDYVLG